MSGKHARGLTRGVHCQLSVVWSEVSNAAISQRPTTENRRGFYSYYLEINDYSRFYAGLSQLMVALIFFQVTAMIIILGAELNRGIMELKKVSGEW